MVNPQARDHYTVGCRAVEEGSSLIGQDAVLCINVA